MANKTHWRTFHPSEYIGAIDFAPDERKIVTIKNAGRKVVKDNKGNEENCLVIHFHQNEKPMICNVTNSKAIEKVSGSAYIEDWKNTRIELFTTTVSAFGDTVEAVRVKPTAPVTKPVMSPDSDRWDGLVKSIAEGNYTVEKLIKQFEISLDDLDLLESQVSEVTNGES